jgi:hypothetical protein
MSEAEKLFSEIYRRFMKNWSVILALRQFSDVKQAIAEQALADIHAGFVEDMVADPLYKSIFVRLDGTDKPMDSGSKQIIQSAMTKLAVTNAKAAVDAASLVFAQSMLDDCAWSYCKACALVGPEDWEQFFGAKAVKFEVLRGTAYENIRKDSIEAKLAEIERKSLLTKVDLLFRICQPPTGFDPIGHYTFDRDRLEQIDNRRHRVVHADGLGEELVNIENDLEYISKTVNYLMALVNQKYGLQLNLRLLFGLQVAKPTET